LFAERCFQEINPGEDYLWNWHLDLIASKLEDCMAGRIRRLIINIPPRHLKSLFASIALPAFWLGHHPNAKLICVSYAQELATALSSSCLQVMRSPWYRRWFRKTRLSSKRQTQDSFATTLGGYRLATSVGGVLTGRGGDVIIIDDPLKPEEAASDAQRAKVNRWYSETLYSRLNRQTTGVIILVMQRLHEDDLVQYVQGKEKWEVLSLPAIAEAEECHRFHSPAGPQEVIRHPGEPLHAAMQSLEILEGIRANLNEYAFSAQYQQRPVPLGGGLVKSAWWTTYDSEPRPFERIIQSWDTASKGGELNDFSVCTTWGWKEKKLYLLDVFRKKLNYPDLKREVVGLTGRFKPNIILIEDAATGTSLIQELPREGVRGIQGCKPKDDKQTRLYTQLCWFEGGNLLLPKAAPWLAGYKAELEGFPNAAHDDLVDSTTQVLAWAQNASHAYHGLRLGPRKAIYDVLDSYCPEPVWY